MNNIDDSRDRLIRVEESLKHIAHTLDKMNDELKAQRTAHASDFKEVSVRVDAVEKRVDKIYWVWGAAVFVGSPVMVIISKLVFAHFGL